MTKFQTILLALVVVIVWPAVGIIKGIATMFHWLRKPNFREKEFDV
jgi:hypothetical protein